MSWRATSCWNFSKLSASSLTWNRIRKGSPSSVSSWKRQTDETEREVKKDGKPGVASVLLPADGDQPLHSQRWSLWREAHTCPESRRRPGQSWWASRGRSCQERSPPGACRSCCPPRRARTQIRLCWKEEGIRYPGRTTNGELSRTRGLRLEERQAHPKAAENVQSSRRMLATFSYVW